MITQPPKPEGNFYQQIQQLYMYLVRLSIELQSLEETVNDLLSTGGK